MYIYCLLDPRSDCVRYVGFTKNPIRRLASHNYHAKKAKTHCAFWINSLHQACMSPVMDIIDVCDENNWQEKEKKWISIYKNLGANLTNLTDGGDGVIGCIQSEETRKKRSISLMGHTVTKESRNKISASHIGKSLSGDHRLKISAAMIGNKYSLGNKSFLGRKHSEDAIRKISASSIGRKHSKEVKRKMSESHMGHCTSEEARQKISYSKKLYWANKKKLDIPA